MAAFQADCPHCGSKQSAFQILNSIPAHAAGDRSRGYFWDVFSRCGVCHRGVVALWMLGTNVAFDHAFSQGSSVSRRMLAIYPLHNAGDIPDFIPKNVENYYKQGMTNLRSNRDAAGAMFRKCIDVGLREKFPDLDNRAQLTGRIEEAARRQKITSELSQWAHQVRIDGANAAHRDDPFTTKEIERLQKFTELLLRYLFELPGMLEAAKGETPDSS